MKRVILLLVSFSSLSGEVFAQTGGTNSYAFLNLVNSARVASVGGNLISVKDNDLSLGLYNPSLLNESMDGNLSFSYVNYFSNTNFGFASYAKHIDSMATFAATLQYMNYGKFLETNEIGDVIGEFNAADYVLSIGAGRSIDSLFSVGANFKTLYSSYYQNSSLAFAADISATYVKPSKGFTAALVMKNMGVQVKKYTAGNHESLPFEVQLGISQKLKHAPFRFSLGLENLQKWDLSYLDPTLKPTTDPTTGELIPVKTPGFGDKLMRHCVIGSELVTKNFFLGLGFNYRRRVELQVNERKGIAGFSFGMGLKIKKIQLSYALASYNQAGTANHITIAFNLNELGK